MSENVDNLNYLNTNSFRQIFQIGLPCNDKQKVLEAIKELESISGIKCTFPEYVDYNLSYQNLSESNSVKTVTTKDDYLNQWGISRIQAKEAREIFSHLTVSDVKVGIIDTGINKHQDLNVISGRHFYYDSYNATQLELKQDNNTEDKDGHGTFVAGLVSAVCPNVTLVPIKVDLFCLGNFCY